MSQVSRQIAICPGLPRRLRVQGRKLCLCGPGGGTTCGICFGRALANDPIGSGLEGCNQCAGLFAPFVSLGERFRVTFSGTAITGGSTVFGTQNTQNVSAVATFSETFTISSQDFAGQCLAVVEDYSGFATMGGQWSEFGGSVSVPGVGVDLAPILFPGGFPSLSLDIVCAGGGGTCIAAGTVAPASQTCADWFAYRHPAALAVRSRQVLDAAFQVFIAQVVNPPFWLPQTLTPWFTPGFFNFTGLGNPLGVGALGSWQGMPCSGFMTTTPGAGSAVPYVRESFSNTQAGLDSSAGWWAEEGYNPNAAAGFSGAKRTTWGMTEHKAVSVPCAPGEGTNPANAAAIAEHMARGFKPGCCGD